MPQKRNEVVERSDASELLPDIYENWLKRQPTANAKAKAGFISEAAEDREEDKIDNEEDAHEKAKRRKRGRAGK